MCFDNPLSFNDNWFFFSKIIISNISRRDVWTGLGTAKVGCFPLFPTFLAPGHVVPYCQPWGGSDLPTIENYQKMVETTKIKCCNNFFNIKIMILRVGLTKEKVKK